MKRGKLRNNYIYIYTLDYKKQFKKHRKKTNG